MKFKKARYHKMICRIFLVLILIFPCLKSGSQILQDSTAIRIITDGMQNIYNLEFEQAEAAAGKLSRLYPGHPVIDLFNGMKVYWENFPLLPSSEARISFEIYMRKCIETTEKDPAPTPQYEAEYLLSNICARGLLLLFYADNDMSRDVIPLAAATYRPLMRSFDFTSTLADFYYFTGVYNYYRDAYPKVYPVYRTVAFMFPQGDMQLGLRQLEECGNRSVALRAEAYFILSWIRMNFETDFEKALPLSLHLVQQYPANPLYRICFVKNLLLLKKYDEAEDALIDFDNRSASLFYNSVAQVLYGLIQEKKYRDFEKARSHYTIGVSALAPFGAYGNEYAAYGYFGLSRIEAGSDHNPERRMFRRRASAMAEFKNITFDD
jgi:hypothetical protein